MDWLRDEGVPWPNGAKCAVCISFDCDGDTPILMSYPDEAYRHVFALSWLQYDRVAVPRIVRMFRDYNIQQTFFIPAWCIEQYPSVFESVLEDGHEIAHHCYLHESSWD